MDIQPPFVTTSSETIKDVKKAVHWIKNVKQKTAVDLGSGNGRIVIELAKLGITAVGFEKNKDLIKQAIEKIEDLHLKNAVIYQKNYRQENLSSFDIVYLYAIPSIMGKIEEKLQNELKEGAIVISNIYEFPHWKTKKKFGTLTLYIKQ